MLDNAYMRGYMKRRYEERRRQALAHLGGKCTGCGVANDLEFDHIDPTTKTLSIAKMWTASEARFWAEIAKCQLLCAGCHKQKSLRERGQQDARLTHGTLSSYRYCKCDECRQAKRDWEAKRKPPAVEIGPVKERQKIS